MIYESALAAFAAHGHELTVEAWSTIVGTNDDDDDAWWDRLCEAAGVDGFDRALLRRRLRGAGPLEPRPPAGAARGGGAGRRAGRRRRAAGHRVVVEPGLARPPPRPARARPTTSRTLVGADLVGGVGKPAPDVYLRACADLGADPAPQRRPRGLGPRRHRGQGGRHGAWSPCPAASPVHNDFSHADLVVAVASLDLTGATDPRRRPRRRRPVASPRAMAFPQRRLRRLRRTPALRRLVAETRLSVDDLVAPLFVREGIAEPQPIASLPGVVQHTRESLRKEVAELAGLGVPAVILFGVPATKDAEGSGRGTPTASCSSRCATCATRSATTLVLMADLCVDEYTDHGHCGMLTADGEVDNDATLEPLRAGRGRPGRRRGRHRGAQRDDGRPGRRHPRRPRRRRPRPTPRSSPTPPSTPRPSTARSATRST